jgi:hypothetical protein
MIGTSITAVFGKCLYADVQHVSALILSPSSGTDKNMLDNDTFDTFNLNGMISQP